MLRLFLDISFYLFVLFKSSLRLYLLQCTCVSIYIFQLSFHFAKTLLHWSCYSTISIFCRHKFFLHLKEHIDGYTLAIAFFHVSKWQCYCAKILQKNNNQDLFKSLKFDSFFCLKIYLIKRHNGCIFSFYWLCAVTFF